MYSKDESDLEKHCLKVFNLVDKEKYADFILDSKPTEHSFDQKIVDFCFNRDGNTLFVCLEKN